MFSSAVNVIRKSAVPLRSVNVFLIELRTLSSSSSSSSSAPKDIGVTCKSENLQKKLREKTPIGKLDELDVGKHPYQEKEPLPEWPDNTNPHTGEVGGPRGPEPTRYGDWERKGRVSDF